MLVPLLALVPSFGAAQDFVAESPLSFAFVASRDDAPVFKAGPAGRETESVSRVEFRITPSDLLDLLVEDRLIPKRRGWRIVAVWANWPDTGNGYRFYAQSVARRADSRPIPENRLRFEAIDGAVARKHSLSGDTVTAGSESFTLYASVHLGDPDTAGVAPGLLTGSGRYAKPKGAAQAFYVPGESKFAGAGVLDDVREGHADYVLEGSLKFRAASTAPASRYVEDGASTGAVFSSGTTVVAGTITLGSIQFGAVGTLAVSGISSVDIASVDVGTLSLSWPGLELDSADHVSFDQESSINVGEASLSLPPGFSSYVFFDGLIQPAITISPIPAP